MAALVKGLLYVWGGVAFIFGIFVFSAAWGNLGTAFAVFGSPVAIFVAPLYFGLTQGHWIPALYLYGSLVFLFFLSALTHTGPQSKKL